MLGRISRKYLAVYREAVRLLEANGASDLGGVMERVHRMRLIVDHASGMTDEFALQTFRLISGMDFSPFRA